MKMCKMMAVVIMVSCMPLAATNLWAGWAYNTDNVYPGGKIDTSGIQSTGRHIDTYPNVSAYIITNDKITKSVQLPSYIIDLVRNNTWVFVDADISGNCHSGNDKLNVSVDGTPTSYEITNDKVDQLLLLSKVGHTLTFGIYKEEADSIDNPCTFYINDSKENSFNVPPNSASVELKIRYEQPLMYNVRDRDVPYQNLQLQKKP